MLSAFFSVSGALAPPDSESEHLRYLTIICRASECHFHHMFIHTTFAELSQARGRPSISKPAFGTGSPLKIELR